MTGFVPRKFRERSAVVEAVQRGDEQTESVGSRLDAVLAELASIVTAEYASDAPRERVVQRIASAASTLAACRQESDVWEIYPDRLAGVRDAIRAGKEGR